MSTSRIDVREILVTGLIVEDEALVVDLDDGRTITVPLAWFPRLSHGTAFERANWHLIAGGEGIHWPELDEDISVASLLSGGRSGETQESFRSWLETRKVPKPLSTAGKVHLSPADHDRLKRDLGQFTVALFGGPGLFMGSGTLVEVADSHYILTAAHVWRKLKKGDHLAVTYKEVQDRPPLIRIEEVADTTLGPSQPEEWGPDISFLRLPSYFAASIERGEQVFYNLSKRKKAALRAGLDVNVGCWIVIGAPEARADLQFDQKDMTIVAFCSEGIHEIHARTGFDYLDVIVPDGSYSYRGVSGGGLWQVLVKIAPSGELFWDHSALNLAGVAFYEQDPTKGRPRLLRCHGKRSLYLATPE